MGDLLSWVMGRAEADQVWGYEVAVDSRAVDVHIKRIREKIKDHDSWKITTVHSIGYKFEVRR